MILWGSCSYVGGEVYNLCKSAHKKAPRISQNLPLLNWTGNNSWQEYIMPHSEAQRHRYMPHRYHSRHQWRIKRSWPYLHVAQGSVEKNRIGSNILSWLNICYI